MREFFDYRLKFSKNGPIRYVGHLDVVRYMQKANRRAELPMGYSEGFSPHQILSVALPLPVGATSDGEYLDMRLTQELAPDEIVSRLNKVMHEGIEARDCMLLPEHAPKAMTVITAAGYRLRLRNADIFRDDPGCALKDFLSRKEILVTKSTKKGETTIDLIPLIHGWTVGEDGELEIILHAGSRDHVKPALLYEAFCDSLGVVFQPQMLAVHRLDLYESPTEGEFVPLIPKAV